MRKISLTFSMLFFITTAFAQSSLIHRELQWKNPVETRVSETETVKSLYFTGASYNQNNLPVFYESFPVESNMQSATAEIVNPVFINLKETDLLPANAALQSVPVVTVEIGHQKKKTIACITVFPFRRSAGGQIQKLVSFDLRLAAASYRNGLPDKSARVYSGTSVLASGEWYKLGVNQTGIYKITWQNLRSMGIDIDQTDPRSIRIYGNGGRQVPYLNSAPRHDDLQENHIYVEGESDGVFGPDDFILFYGEQRITWTYNSTTQIFNHALNEYSDTTYYFLTTSQGTNGKRIQQRASSSASPDQTISSYDDYEFHEAELVNFLKSGRKWYGENLDNQNSLLSFNYEMRNMICNSVDPVKITAFVLGRSLEYETNWRLLVNSQQADLKNIQRTSGSTTADFALTNILSASVTSSPDNFNIGISFSSTEESAVGWLDYIEINARRELDFTNETNHLLFRDSRSIGAGSVGEFMIANANATLKVWDVTDPINIAEQLTSFDGSTTVSFKYPTDILRQYLAFAGNAFPSPAFTGMVENQNLHAMQQAQMIIVTNKAFLAEANRLADFHRSHDGYNVNVATTSQVFNEFSGGAQDVSAIRDFAKMFYDRSTSQADMPRFLLLFGDASYDCKYRLPNNTNFVTAYQSEAALNQTTTYISDDFFGLLDDNEGIWAPSSTNELMDISVGRLPAKTLTEANAMVGKIITYCTPDAGTSSAESVFGDWRNIVTFVADDQDNNTHYNQSESLAAGVLAGYPVYNVDKIYLDAYKQIATPGGQRFPDARDAIVKRVERGSLLLTYIGHGGEVGWAHERVLEIEDINGWTNNKHLPAFLTATCEFSRPDDPARTSAGEMVLLNPNGGGICLFTTTRLAFSGSNFSIAQKFFNNFFEPENDIMPTCGEVFERTKIQYNDRYTRNFVLLGDPAVRLAYPKYNVVTNTINSHPVSANSDTLRALSKVTITGDVRDNSGNKLTGFNGVVYPTIYDKLVKYSTLGNDAGFSGDGGSSIADTFAMQKNILYRGKAQAHNGDFSFTFVVPKDISYQFGNGKISYYAQNGQIDANGYSNDIVVGGLNPLASTDNKGPDVKLYLNDEKFAFGGLTDPNPVLYAMVSDSNGINTVGNGIGHDITSTMDGEDSRIVVLNDYYESDLDNYQSGKVRFQYNDLSVGSHSLLFKVWDVYNNSSEARTEFIVAESAKIALEHVLNYPNPFTTHTTFMFEHNRPYSQLNAQVQIFTISGKLVKTLNSLITTEGYRSDDIQWNGLDDYGDRIGRGVYVYKLKVKDFDGNYAEKFEKLVILR